MFYHIMPCRARTTNSNKESTMEHFCSRTGTAVASVQDHLAFKRQLVNYINPQILLLSLFSPQYGLSWAICPFPIIKYIHIGILIPDIFIFSFGESH